MSTHCIPAGEPLCGMPTAGRPESHPASRPRFHHPVLVLTLIAGLGAVPPPSSADQVSIGTSTSKGLYPLRTDKQAVRTQTICLASEMPGGGTITSVKIHVATAPTTPVTRTCTVGLKHITGSTLTQFEEGAQTVYDHSITISTAGWMEFALDTPFVYNGQDNLLVEFILRGTGVDSATRCYVSSASVTTLIAYGSTSDAPLTAGGTYGSRPNMELTIGPAVTSVTPSQGANTGPVSVNVAGAHFEQGASVQLENASGHIHGTVAEVTSSQIACTFNLTGAPPGLYDMVVTNPDELSGRKSGCFVVEGMAGLLPVEVEGFRAVRTRTGAVALRWSAAAGVEIAGYRLWRAYGTRGPFVRVGRRLIASGGRAFHCVDSGARRLAPCVYRLDVVSVAGRVIRSLVVTAPPAPRAPARRQTRQ